MPAVAAWDWWAVLFKTLSLMAIAGAIGGCFVLNLARNAQCQRLSALLAYVRYSAVAGIGVLTLHFLLQVGAVNASGLAGMFDPLMVGILLQSGIGKVLALRVTALLLIALWLRQKPNLVELLLCITGILILCSSFLLTGHVSVLAPVARLLLALHVLAIMLWMGSLYPLLYLCSEAEIARAQKVMVNFGKLALLFVAVLLLSGLYLATTLLQTIAALWSNPYGVTLLLKLGAVSVLLTLGALNKLVLVPKLHTDAARQALQTSIRTEMLLGVAVLAITSWLTTVVSPTHPG